MELWESLKKSFLLEPEDIKSPSNVTDDIHVVKNLSGDNYEGTMVFSNVDSAQEWQYGGTENSLMLYQNRIISMYRQLARHPDVNNAVDQIVNEMVFTVDKEEFKITIDEENNTIKDKINEIFENVQLLLNTKDNLHSICRQLYIDGQLNVALTYDSKNVKAGIKQAQILEPQYLFFNKDDKQWEYAEAAETDYLYNIVPTDVYAEIYKPEEMIHIDFGLSTHAVVGENQRGRVNLSYLENAFKAANQLDTLENMLVPMRYSRSVSRRMFNIDVADLPPKKAKELMDKIRSEFRYKKTYDTETGTIKNMQSTQPLVEDYWMSNRSGSKGTTVDTMDEKGGLMDLEDIIYMSKKLYSALKLPSSRNPYTDEMGGDFSYDTDSITGDELQFFLHIDRLRLPVVKLYKEVLKRQIIATGVLTEQEWNKYSQKIEIEFSSKSIFLENMERDLLLKSFDNWEAIKEEVGVTISFEKAVRQTLKWTNVELQEEMEAIKTETNNPLYQSFYASKGDGF